MVHLVQGVSADLGGNIVKMDKSAKVSTVVDLNILIDCGKFGAFIQFCSFLSKFLRLTGLL